MSLPSSPMTPCEVTRSNSDDQYGNPSMEAAIEEDLAAGEPCPLICGFKEMRTSGSDDQDGMAPTSFVSCEVRLCFVGAASCAAAPGDVSAPATCAAGSGRGTFWFQANLSNFCAGLLPFYMVGTIGTTSSCAVDPIGEMGAIAQKYKLW